MSKDYDNTNRGALFKNDRKEKDSHPDYTGTINVGGSEYWLNAWLNKIKRGENAGNTYMSVTVTRKTATNAPEGRADPGIDSDMPF